MKIKGYSNKIIELDGLRGIACIIVLLHHYFTGVMVGEVPGIPENVWELISTLLVSGVDLFFVLSGFLVGGIIIDLYQSSNFLKVFYIRRVCRIFPVYYALLLSFVIGMYTLQGYAFTTEALLKHPFPIWPYLTFLQSYFFGLANNSGPLWVAPTWSVSVEEQFYMLTPLIFLIFGARRAFWVVIGGIVAAPFIRYVLLKLYGDYAAYMMFPGRMDSIFWGVLLAFALRNEKVRDGLVKNARIIYVVMAAAFAFLAFDISINYVTKFTLLAILYTGTVWSVLEHKNVVTQKITTSKLSRM